MWRDAFACPNASRVDFFDSDDSEARNLFTMKRSFFGVTTCSAVISAALVLGTGCHREEAHSHDDDDHHHGEEPKVAQFTVWGERHEIFAEHRLVVAGQPTKFVTHVTDLQTLEPRREGPITFVLRRAMDAPIEHGENKPTRAGIYEAMLTFPHPGDWNVSVNIPGADGQHSIALPPVKVFATAHDAQHGEVAPAPEGLSFLKEQQWKIRSGTEPARRRRLVERVHVPGLTRAKPGSSAAVVAPLPGSLVQAANQSLIQPGRRVEAGEVLALLRPRFSDAALRLVEIESESGQAVAVLKQAEAVYERTKKLAALEAKSPRELQEAELALTTARARAAAAESLRSTYSPRALTTNGSESSSSSNFELRAPIAGIVTRVNAGWGEPVTADQIVFTVLNPDLLWLEGAVPEAALARVSLATNALCEVLDGSGRLLPVSGESGRLIFLGLELDPTNRTAPILFEFSNAQARLRVGQAVRLHIETAHAEDTLALPDSAIVEEAGQPIAFVQLSGETFEKRELQLGFRDGDHVQVLAGLKEGERVVIRGAYALRLASLSGVIPAHGHAH